MYAVLSVRIDDSHRQLGFASKADAEQFLNFVRVYMTDSGAGNGYGAYWVADGAIGLYEQLSQNAITALEQHRINTMLHDILKARLAVNQPPSDAVTLVHGTWRNAISFQLPPLPDRQRPTAGDMCRVLRHLELLDDERHIHDGRVLEDHGETLVVISPTDEKPDGQPEPNATRRTVRSHVVMKINDWLGA